MKTLKTLLLSLLMTTLTVGSSLADNKLSAEDSRVKRMYSTIREELRIPSKVFDLCEGESPVVHFTIDSLGYLKVLDVETESAFLEKQLTRAFESIKTYDAEALTGERFSLQLNLHR